MHSIAYHQIKPESKYWSRRHFLTLHFVDTIISFNQQSILSDTYEVNNYSIVTTPELRLCMQ